MKEELNKELAIEKLRQLHFFGAIDWFDEVDSTSLWMRRKIELRKNQHPNQIDQLSRPSICVADSQSAGRGRGDKHWWSPGGCLMFSFSWIPPESNSETNDSKTAPISGGGYHNRLEIFPLVTASSIATTLNKSFDLKQQVKVKWPNDMILDDRKLGGILIERIPVARRSMNDLDHAYDQVPSRVHQVYIIGIGLNVSVDFTQADSELRRSSISLHEARNSASDSNGRSLSLKHKVLVDVLTNLTLLLRNFPDSFLSMTRCWADYCYLSGKRVRVSSPDSVTEGTCKGVDGSGRLMVQVDSGSIYQFHSGSVTVVD